MIVKKNKLKELDGFEVLFLEKLGNYRSFITDFVNSDAYTQDKKVITMKEQNIRNLNKGKLLDYNDDYLICKEGFEIEYLNHCKDFLNNLENKELFEALEDKKFYSIALARIKMTKIGISKLEDLERIFEMFTVDRNYTLKVKEELEKELA